MGVVLACSDSEVVFSHRPLWDHVVVAIGCLETSPTKVVGIGLAHVEGLRIHGHHKVL